MSERDDDARCTACGHPRREHHHGGACYGVCGEFTPSPTEPPLLPCPFCARPPRVTYRGSTETATQQAWFIACMCGGNSARAHQFGTTFEEAAGRWNTRADAVVGAVANDVLAWLIERVDLIDSYAGTSWEALGREAAAKARAVARPAGPTPAPQTPADVLAPKCPKCGADMGIQTVPDDGTLWCGSIKCGHSVGPDSRNHHQEPMSTREQTTHCLERTSPLGGPFMGRCVLCGKEGLPASAANGVCDNPQHVSGDDAILSAITGERPAPAEAPATGEAFKAAADIEAATPITAEAPPAAEAEGWRVPKYDHPTPGSKVIALSRHGAVSDRIAGAAFYHDVETGFVVGWIPFPALASAPPLPRPGARWVPFAVRGCPDSRARLLGAMVGDQIFPTAIGAANQEYAARFYWTHWLDMDLTTIPVSDDPGGARK